MVDVKEVSARASGRWLEILPALSPASAPALAVAAVKRGARYARCPCPVCGGTDRFNYKDDAPLRGDGYCNTCGVGDGYTWLRRLNGWSFGQALRAVDAYTLRKPSPAPTARPANVDATEERIRAVNSILEGARTYPLESHAKYLAGRGLNAVYADLLYHPGQPYYHRGAPLRKPCGTWMTWPTIVAPIRDRKGVIQGVHRTYLTRSGVKAGAELSALVGERAADKLMLSKAVGSLAGCGVYLHSPAPRMAACEGIETGLAVHKLTGLPVVAGLTANGLGGLELPSSVREVLIYADMDANEAGAKAADKLMKRLKSSGVAVSIHMPTLSLGDSKSVDWLDEWNARA